MAMATRIQPLPVAMTLIGIRATVLMPSHSNQHNGQIKTVTVMVTMLQGSFRMHARQSMDSRISTSMVALMVIMTVLLKATMPSQTTQHSGQTKMVTAMVTIRMEHNRMHVRPLLAPRLQTVSVAQMRTVMV